MTDDTTSSTTGTASKVWFITGTSKGFGREWATAALERGDRVAGTARDVSTMDDLVERFGDDKVLAIQLDVTDRQADFDAVAMAHEHFGRLDIVINNAGYGHFGFIEELSEDDLRAQLETNFFGAMWITQAALPFLRAQGSGHIIQVSSIGGITAFPMIGAYHASKWALEAFSQSLAAEVAGWGISVTLVEPGGFSTDWSGPSAKRSDELADYAAVREQIAAARKAMAASAGDPHASAKAILEVVDADEKPLRVFFGSSPLTTAKKDYESRIANWEKWQHVSELAQG